ncbi:3-oxoadipate enol-lactonase/3-oxoadipate enol-lactonase / 4-carboxymuconolactone decarboxylase [Lentzea xinjiangensis]|uniref:3-oxoadipate enol-lactonase/3-oxoadipate enol-lactonase / 4-carboxymuconolactone decarboxylase n=1 Tax=Lentzea xinjiangensis TaxID=402600 RepID=A0A1H9LY45_9PSEU|nr:alpha/beta fold hydrolase [Lentzea xinjiangensis]SER16372.1 3-oxoadipate enol-lactonase/3-oxoadipate enol-lactonase / 4-carboxymuconolactone decarboxylase [Lentzea xinjiangensis]
MVELSLTRLAGTGTSGRLLLVGPSLGTSVASLWRDCAGSLPGDVEVVGWDLPGHGAAAPATGPFTVRDVADAVAGRGAALAEGRPVDYAGVSFGGAVGFDLATRADGPFGAVVCIAAAPRIGQPEMWRERAALVRRAGTPAVVEGAAHRWFAPGFADRSPGVAGELLAALAEVDDESYALACEALAGFEARAAVKPLWVLVGAHDVVVSPENADLVLSRCGHLPPAEDPAGVAVAVRRVLEEMRCPTTTA